MLIAFLSLGEGSGESINGYDKPAHFLAYAFFSWIAGFWQQQRRGYLIVCLAIVAYGGLMEFGQSFVPGRQMSFYDFVANGLGVLLGAFFSRWK